MKGVFIFFSILFLGFSLHGQRSDTIAIKIYLEDAETSKNVCDAKVTLEGFEIPAIVGKYDKKGKFYYFTEVPKGYNTIMAYHKKYNEKGFQNTEGLPKEIKLQLFDPMNVSYRFESNPYKDSVQVIYIEDPYKFGITSVNDGDYTTFRKYIINEIEKLNLNVELVNPFLEMEKNTNIPLKFRGKLSYCNDFEFCKNANYVKQIEAYPDLRIETKPPIVGYEENKLKPFPIIYTNETILPLLATDSNNDFYCLSTYEEVLYNNGSDFMIPNRETNIIFYVRKKDGKKFKRYNDPIIRKIREINRINTFSVTYRKYYHNSKKGKFYKNSYTKDLDRFNNFKNIDSSKVFFYHTKRFVKYKNRFFFKLFTIKHQQVFGSSCVEPHQYYKNKYKHYKENLRYKYQALEKLEKHKKLVEFDQSIGLGILDKEEIICDSILKN